MVLTIAATYTYNMWATTDSLTMSFSSNEVKPHTLGIERISMWLCSKLLLVLTQYSVAAADLQAASIRHAHEWLTVCICSQKRTLWTKGFSFPVMAVAAAVDHSSTRYTYFMKCLQLLFSFLVDC